MAAAIDPRFGETLRRIRTERGLSLRELAVLAVHGKSYLHELETGAKRPNAAIARRLDEVLGAGGVLTALLHDIDLPADGDDELEALDLLRRMTASDVGGETLDRIELTVDEFAMAYATTAPADLLARIGGHLRFAAGLLDARKTLVQHHRLMVGLGWLSMLKATALIDLRQNYAARANLRNAARFARESEHGELAAWCLETRAWQVLTDGDFEAAVQLAQRAQAVAPADGSALIQATAQEGRAWARMKQRSETRDALDRVERLTSSLPVPDRPEHHYRYDPDKALSYTATTLAWAGDPAAEEYARAVVAHLVGSNGTVGRPRRTAIARLDLALALLAADKADEAAAAGITAITSGRVVPSNWWRATEVLAGVERLGLPEASDLRDAYETFANDPYPPVNGGGRPKR